MTEYLNEFDVDTDALSEFLKTRQGDENYSPQKIQRFYASRLGEVKHTSFGVEDRVHTHLNRLVKLQEMDENNASYTEMLQVYLDMGGMDGYTDNIRDMIKLGKRYDTDRFVTLTEEDIKAHEMKFTNIKAGGINELLDDARRMLPEPGKNKGSFEDMFTDIEDKAQEKKGGFFRKATKQDEDYYDAVTDYNKSKKSHTLTVKELISFESKEKERESEKHLIRLRKLFGEDQRVDFDNLDKLQPPSDEKVKEERRIEYLKSAKQFMKDKDIQSSGKEAMNKILEDPAALKREILEYEAGRQQYYEDEHSCRRKGAWTSHGISQR